MRRVAVFMTLRPSASSRGSRPQRGGFLPRVSASASSGLRVSSVQTPRARAFLIGLLLSAMGLGSVWAGSMVDDSAPAIAFATGQRLQPGWFRAGAAVETLVPPADKWVQGDDCSGP